MTRNDLTFMQGLVVACVLLMGMTRAEAQATSLPGNEHFNRACELAGGAVSALCVTLEHLVADDHDILGFDAAEPSTHRAIGVIATLLTDSKPADQDVLPAVLPTIKAALLKTGNARRYCDGLKAGLPESMRALADVACLRPACLVTADFSSIAAQCAPVTSSSSQELRKEVAQFVANHYQQYGCAKPQKAGAVCAVEEATELVIKVDQLLAFARAYRAEMTDPASCKASARSDTCQAALTRSLEELGRVWSMGTVVNEALQRSEPLRAALDPQQEFQRQWSSVEAAIPTAEAIAAREVESFPFEIKFVRELAASRPALAAVLSRLRDHVQQESVRAWTRGRTIAAALEAVPFELDADCKKSLAELPASIERTESRLLEVGLQMQDLAPCVQRAETALLKVQAKLSVTDVQEACAKGEGSVSVAHGIADFCFETGTDAVGPIGMRFVFRPCAQLQDVPCITTGELRMLIRAQPGPEPIVLDYHLGISGIRARVSGTDITPIAIPPSPAYASPDLTLAAQALAKLLPPAFVLTEIGQLELAADMSVRIKGIRVTAAEIALPSLCAVFSPKALSFGVEPECTDQSSIASDISGSLVRTARAALAAQIARKKAAMALPGLPVQMVQAKMLLQPDDRCTERSAPLKDVAIASIDHLIAICGSISLALSDSIDVPIGLLWQTANEAARSDWRIVADEQKLRAALQNVFKQANIEAISLQAQHIEAQITVDKGCRARVPLSITDDALRRSVTKFAEQLSKCALASVVERNLPSFDYFGLEFSAQDSGTRFCLQRPTIEGGPVCMRNVRLTGGKPDFTRAVLDDQGRVAKYLKNQLQSAVPGAVTVQEVLPKLKLEVSLPLLGPTAVELSPEVGNALRDTAVAQFRAKLGKLIENKSIDAGPVTVIARSVKPVKPEEAIKNLSLAVDIEYDTYTLPATLQILPSIKLNVPANAEALLGAITSLVGGIEVAGSKVYAVTGADGIPVVRCAIAMPLDLAGLKASGTLEWRPGKGRKPEFAGPVSITWATYTPIFTGVDLGDITAAFDPSSQNISLDATLALTSGDVTRHALRLTGRLAYDKLARTITADAGLFVAGMRLARSVGVVNLRQASVESTIAPEGVAAHLPLPEAKVGIYGNACMVSGKASIRLFKSFELADVVAVLILPDSCGDEKAAAFQQAKLAELKSEACAYSGTSGLLCVAGRVDVVSLFQSEAVIRTPLGSFSPVISVHGDVGFAELDVNASLKRIKVKADLKIVRVTVMFPSVSGIDATLLRQLLKNLLKPSIDWDSVLKGDIVISPDTGKSGEAEELDEGPEGGPPTDAKPAPNAQEQTRASAPAQPSHASSRPAAGGPGIRLAFSSGSTLLRVADDGNIMNGASRYWVQSIDRKGMLSERNFPVRVRQDVVAALRSPARDALALVPGSSAFQLEDGWYVLMCRGTPCAANTFVAEPVSLDAQPVSPARTPKPVPAIAGFVGLDAGSNWVLTGTLPRLAQRALLEGAAPEIACATSDAGVCTTAIFRLQAEPSWSYFPSRHPASVIVSDGSLWHRALSRMPIAQALALIDQTKVHQVFALASGPDGQLRAFMKRSYSVFRQWRLTDGQATEPTFGSGALLEVSSNASRYDIVQLQRLQVDDRWAWWPWRSYAAESPLDKVLQELSAADLGHRISVAASETGDRATLQVRTSGGAESRLIFAMRYQGRACHAAAKTSAQIDTVLDGWSKPVSFTDPQAGRIRQGADLKAVHAALPRTLLRPESHEPFLIDPMFVFYPEGSCQ